MTDAAVVNEQDRGEHDKEVTIYVNTRPKVVHEKELTFTMVVRLAFPTAPFGDNTAYTVTYRRGKGDKPEGIMVEGDSVKVKEGMVFDVSATDKS